MYYGLKATGWKKYYWISMVNLFEQFIMPYQQLEMVYYFTARPHDIERRNPDNPNLKILDSSKREKQNLFILANEEDPKFEIVLGYFQKKTVKNGTKKVNTYEEKKTDVNIAVQMLGDVAENKCDISFLVTADSDLIPAVEKIKTVWPEHKVFVFSPPNRLSQNLQAVCHASFQLLHHEERFNNAKLPNEIKLSSGKVITKPQDWNVTEE